MRLELTAREIEVLRAVLESAHRARLHELRHTDSREYREWLRGEIAIVEELRTKVAAEAVIA